MDIPIEPSSDLRQGAKGLREMYVSLTNGGFDPHQALYLVGVMLSASVGEGKPDSKP